MPRSKELTIPCPLCHRLFSRGEFVERHLRMHTGEKPYQCDFPGCGMSFSRRDNMNSHRKRVHPGAPPILSVSEGNPLADDASDFNEGHSNEPNKLVELISNEDGGHPKTPKRQRRRPRERVETTSDQDKEGEFHSSSTMSPPPALDRERTLSPEIPPEELSIALELRVAQVLYGLQSSSTPNSRSSSFSLPSLSSSSQSTSTSKEAEDLSLSLECLPHFQETFGTLETTVPATSLMKLRYSPYYSSYDAMILRKFKGPG